jgi:hypothetical protein
MTAAAHVNGDLAAARAARDVILAASDGSPAYQELLRAAHQRITELRKQDRTEPVSFKVTVSTAAGDKWVEAFDTAEGAAAEVFGQLALIDGAAFTITSGRAVR